MKSKKLVISICLVMVLVLSCFSYATNKKPLIGAILLDTKQEWFAEVIKGMEKAGKDLKATVKIMSADSDVAKEADLIDNLIAQKVDAISISPNNDQASVPAFERAVDAGIPVVTWNSKVNSPKSKYFVGVDNYSLGAQTGEYAVKYINQKMGGKAKVAILACSKYSVGIQRTKGFLDKIKQVKGVEIVAQQDAEFKEAGLSVTESILQAHPNTQIVWAWNQGALLGALAALKGKNNKTILLMGTDMSIDLAKAMLEPGSFLTTITTQQPFEIGYTSIKNAVELAKFKKTKNEVLVPLKTYTLDNKAEIQKYLDERRYLIQ
jgi:ABC-type sugar transport system substrate-binding protein